MYHENLTAMMLMRNRNIIAHAKRKWNLFTLDLATPNQAMTAKAIAIRGKSRPTHLVSRNKQIQRRHQPLAYVSNVGVVKASKLVDVVDLDPDNKKYDPAKLFIDSNNSDNSKASANENVLPVDKAWDSVFLEPVSVSTIPLKTTILGSDSVHLTKKNNENDVLNKLFTPCVGSKSTWVIRQNKSMKPTTNKREEVHMDLWGPHDLPPQSGSVYAAILMYEHTRKTWTLYLQGKDDFVDVFQA